MVIFIIWIAFILSEQNKKNELHKKAYENKNFCNVIMSSEDAETLKFNQY